MKRSKARESAFILLFENIFNPEYSFADMKEFASDSELFEIDAFTEALYAAGAKEDLVLFLRCCRCDQLDALHDRQTQLDRLDLLIRKGQQM